MLNFSRNQDKLFSDFTPPNPRLTSRLGQNINKKEDNLPNKRGEEDYNSKILNLKQFYNLRLQNFEQGLETLYTKILDDELFKTLKKDALTIDFVHDRVKELMEEVMNSQNEIMINNMNIQNSRLKDEIRSLELEKQEQGNDFSNQIQTLSSKCEDLNSQIFEFKCKNTELINENNELKQKLSDFSFKFKAESQSKEDEKNRLVEKTHYQISELSSQIQGNQFEIQTLIKKENDLANEVNVLKREKENNENLIQTLTSKIKILENESKIMEQKDKDNEKREHLYKEKLKTKNDEILSLKNLARISKENAIKIENEANQKNQELSQILSTLEEKYNKLKSKLEDKKESHKEKLSFFRESIEGYEKKIAEERKKADSYTQASKEIVSKYEAKIKEIEKAHLLELENMEIQHNSETKSLKEKYQNILESNLVRQRNDSSQETAKFKSVEETLRTKIQELENKIENDYIIKADYLKVLNDNENMVELFRKELDEKEERFHNEMLEKQMFYEEKFNKDLELIQGNAQNKINYYEKKYNEESMIYSQLSEHFAKMQAEIQIQHSAKIQLEQDLQKIKAENARLVNEVKQLTIEMEDSEENKMKNNGLIEELRQTNASLSSKNEKFQRDSVVQKKKIEELAKEADSLNEKMMIMSQKYESLTFELEKNQRKYLNEERNSKITISQLKENYENLKRQNEYLQEKLNESDGIVITDTKMDYEVIINEKDELINAKEAKIAKLEKNIRNIENSLITTKEENAKLSLRLQEYQNIPILSEDKRQKIIFQLSTSLDCLRRELFIMKSSFSKHLKANLSYFIGFVTSLKRIIDKKETEANFLNTRLNSFSEREKSKKSESMELQETNKNLFFELELKDEQLENLKRELEFLRKESSSPSNLEKSEENKRLFNELMQLRSAIDTLYTKHKQILDEVTSDIESLKEKQAEEIAHVNNNYKEMINLMTDKIRVFEQDENAKNSNILRMSHKILHLEKVNKNLESKLRESSDIPLDTQLKSYESPYKNDNSGEMPGFYDNNTEIFLEDQEKNVNSNDLPMKKQLFNSMHSHSGQQLANNAEGDNLSYLNILAEEKKPFTKREIEELKTLLDYTNKNLAENQEYSKKFNEEADYLTDKVKDFQKMQQMTNLESSFLRKYGSHRNSKSHEVGEGQKYSEKLTQLYSPLSTKIAETKEDANTDRNIE